MPGQNLAVMLHNDLRRLSRKRRTIVRSYGNLSCERALLERRLELLKELLALEGCHVDLPDFTSPT